MGNEIAVGIFVVSIVVMIGYNKYVQVKAQKAFEAAQKVIRDKIAVLEEQLKALKK